jgi:hypothetical protein
MKYCLMNRERQDAERKLASAERKLASGNEADRLTGLLDSLYVFTAPPLSLSPSLTHRA